MALPPAPEAGDRSGLAGDAVRRIMHIAAAMRHYQDEEIAGLGLTPAAARALHELDPDRPLPARDLAERLACDRSNVTALVDKLEQAGLVERRVDPADRRQKTLVVTGEGRRVRDRVRLVMSDSRLLGGLTSGELATLRELVWKVSDGGCPQECGEA
ncbi:MarR family winged helix-turn-helix transcriptional regulator [Micromonospora chaiyaphumensis]|uniref:Transcriptional regulator, MarR family n=1 Tax=Micromonospora chaiyaphumensis TaxID=307119 RepID=A0A1C4Z2X9_9ACTN|nr:MarR family winged helix-turn-helix transcriptional regulator [Micromonospora chaiyaphumensis]SCF27293.1 transcriptional regulator, MarR family [Micromonospora chaiyaphumensis]